MPNCVTAVADDALNGAAFTVRVGPSDVARVSALLGYLRQARPDVKKIGMVDDGSDSGQVYDRLLTDRAGRSGITYVGRGPDSDPGAAIQQLVAQGAQAVVLPDQPASATRTSQAVRQLGLSGKLQLLGFGGLATYDFPAQAGDLSVDSILVATNQGYLTGTPESAWSSGYRAFVNAITHQYGLATNGVEMRGTPAPADCVLGWSRAVERAGSFAGADVMKAWETLDIPAAETALGVRERVTAAEHTAVAPDGVFVYSWSKDGSRYRLKQLAGPSAG